VAAAAPQRLWLFDLDNTLHNTSHAIFPRIDAGMTRAVMESLSVDIDTANALRAKYWKRYGATVIGMVRHHGVNADDFLRMSHDFDVRSLIKAEAGLAGKLRRLPGRKVLLTNAPIHYARAVVRHLGLLHQFDSLWAIEHMNWHGSYRPKPSPALLRRVLAREGVSAANTVLVEDTLENLRGARRAGLRTVHIHHPGTPFSKGGRNRPGYVDLRVNSVSELLLRRRPLR
jgi:putative hydrolase of the HAD superfamily